MSKTFQLKVNETYSFDITEAEINAFDSIKTEVNNQHILHNNTSFKAQIISQNFNKKTYTVQVNGNVYEVAIANELDMLINQLGLEVTSTKKENDMKAPMPGLIVSVDVVVGQEVAEGEGVLVLEAMKMENTLTAPKSGVIKSIAVSTGDKVEKNAVLIEME